MTPAPVVASSQALEDIASLCDARWDHFYTKAKLGSDPVYSAVVREVHATLLPVLDIGCGIGLLAHYLRACGLSSPVTGFDYDPRKIHSARQMATKAGHGDMSFASGDARTGLPEFSGHVVILDILQFFTEAEQDALLTIAASRVAPGGKLIIRSGLRDESWRFRVTVLGDYLAKVTFWMKAAPTRYPEADQFRRVLNAAGLNVRLEPMWGGTPFNNYLIVGER
ncbi:class I SAM-dependent methyltransferase [Brevifollis gellanilyticus]|uniref:Methyltransferase n=1 Tax=Brevifollis gellanilyticus TaxID=748831 RepID=A0A512M1Z2_9BACT|nr:class I SAM-dependent methyltransferase [Brevifollis gellanilyticus]GEP40764.1 methyltransferase [Brevifollis gellanilyticus]